MLHIVLYLIKAFFLILKDLIKVVF